MPSLLGDSPLPASSADAARLLEEQYGLTGEIEPLAGDRDRNFLVRSEGAGELMLKVAHPAEDVAVLETQQHALQHLRTWDPSLPVAEAMPTLSGELVTTGEVAGSMAPVRLVTYLPGATIEETGWNRALRRNTMRVLARLGDALASFRPGRLGAPDEWRPTALAELRPLLEHAAREDRAKLEAWIDYFASEVEPELGRVRSQVVHGDCNPANLLVAPENPDDVVGIIDFGDLTIAPLVADPAIAAAYMALESDDPMKTIALCAANYDGCRQLTGEEISLFPVLAISRLVQSLLISGWRAALHPENRDYILLHAGPIRATLDRIDLSNPAGLCARVRNVCADAAEPPTTAELLTARNRRMGPGLRLSYDEPIRMRSGDGVWLTDSDGNRYLDAYNNVPHIGHGHPAVAAALARQTRRLNTNTRYLVDEAVAFADRLGSLLPAPLDTVFFANSGSEANDLAWRIARTVTGRTGMVITSNAYHGSTQLAIDTSPEEVGNLPSWVETAPAEDGGPPSAEDVTAAAGRLQQREAQPAAFACDTVFSSDGIYIPSSGYFESVYRAVRAEGGLCIADEVQAGYGRVGSQFWGFAAGTAVPDLVTLGKPMGNGHPLAAVVTSREIAAAFSDKSYYFSTFGGNSVAAVVGNVVLDVMEREGLAAHADEVGEHIRSGVAGLLADTAIPSRVRGRGLFIGVELNDENGDPDSRLAHWIHNEMRRRKVLIGRTGPHHNVLKIRPPLVFEQHHADLLLHTLEAVLASRVG